MIISIIKHINWVFIDQSHKVFKKDIIYIYIYIYIILLVFFSMDIISLCNKQVFCITSFEINRMTYSLHLTKDWTNGVSGKGIQRKPFLPFNESERPFKRKTKKNFFYEILFWLHKESAYGNCRREYIKLE